MIAIKNFSRRNAASEQRSSLDPLIRVYLLTYNIVQCSLWLHTLYLILTAVPGYWSTLIDESGLRSSTVALLYDHVSPSALRAQRLSWLEVLHAAAGIAGGGVAPAFVQALGRSAVLLVLVEKAYAARSSIAAVTLIASAAGGDIVRYLFYAASSFGECPRCLLIARYTFFLVCYPIGIASEWLLYYISLNEVDTREIARIRLPNAWNFAFDYGVWNRGVLIAYVYFGPTMFLYMYRQRQKKLSSLSSGTDWVASQNTERSCSMGDLPAKLD